MKLLKHGRTRRTSATQAIEAKVLWPWGDEYGDPDPLEDDIEPEPL